MGDLGKRLVSAMLREKTIEPLNSNGIEESLLFEDAKTVFKLVMEFYVKNSDWPTVQQVQENTKIQLPNVVETLEYVSDLVRQRSLGKSLEKAVRSVVRKLDARKPDEALDDLSDSVTMLLRNSTVRDRVASYRETGPKRTEDYIEQRNSGQIQGFKTPWETLDTRLLGWINGTLNVLIGVQNTGKTWLECIIANDALLRGKKVLFVSLEMACLRILRRLDAVRHKIPFGDLLKTEVDLFSFDRWRESLKKDVAGDGDILVTDKKSVRTVADTISLVREHSPDIVLVDGGYRYEGSGNRGDWESSKAIIADLQNAAEMTNIPWVVSSQQGKISANSKLQGQDRAAKVKYAQEWVINPDIVLEAVQGHELRALQHMEIHILKVRDDPTTDDRDPVTIRWDMEFMNFDEVNPNDPHIM